MRVVPQDSRVLRQREGAGEPASTSERGIAPAAELGGELLPRRVTLAARGTWPPSALSGWIAAPTSPEERRFALWRRHCRWLAPRTRLLADALGACRCWGVDASCPRCAGHGAPGWKPRAP